jgi:hypothetical protein
MSTDGSVVHCAGEYRPCGNVPKWLLVTRNAWAREHGDVRIEGIHAL